MFSKKLRALAFFLMCLMVFYVLPANCLQDAVSALSSDETVNTSESLNISGETNASIQEETLNSSEKIDAPYEEPYVLGEDESKREESVKHFRMSDGSYVAVQYAEPVHYLDSDGTYVEYDNTLSLSSATLGETGLQSGSISASNINKISGYKANKSDVSITLANNASQSALTSISKGEYSVSIIPLSLNTSSKVVVNNTKSKPTLSSKPTIEEASKLYNHTSSVKYMSLFTGADLEYVLSGSNLKENIIVNEKATSYVYIFNLNLTGLYATLNEDGSISLIGNNTDKVEFTIPTGYMFDADGEYSENVTYTLTSKPNGNYTLTVTADSEWINSSERVFPVTVDPTIEYGKGRVTDICVGSDGTSYSTYLAVGRENGVKYESYIKINYLPTIPENARLCEATLELKLTTSASVSNDAYVRAYFPTEDWTENVEYSDVSILIDPVSYFKVDPQKMVHSLDLTEAFYKWYNGENNYGVRLKNLNDSRIIFASSNNSFTNNYYYSPMFVVKYINMDGLKDQWEYTSHSAADAGTGYVNLANGALTFSVDTVSTTDYIMPYMPSLTYVSGISGKSNIYSNANVPYVYGSAGLGFKWSMSESIVKKDFFINSATTVERCYVYVDSSGSEYTFKLDSDLGKYVDDDGAGMELTVEDNEYEIKFANKTIKTFKKYSESNGMKEGAVLSSIIDPNGNKIMFSFVSFGRVSTINIIPKNSSAATQLNIIHNGNGVVSRILNPDTQQAAIFYYSTSQSSGTPSTSSYGYLRKIVYAHQTNSTELSNWADFMTDGENEYITVDETVEYTYSSGRLYRAIDSTSKLALQFSYSNEKVSSVCEKAGNNLSTTGRTVNYEYGEGYAKVSTSGADDVINTDDDIISTYTFDRFGRTKNVFSYKEDGTEIYGGTGYIYENEGGDYANLDRVKNNIKHSATAGGNDTNYLLDGDFENVVNYGEDVICKTWNTSNATIQLKSQSEQGSNAFSKYAAKINVPYNQTIGYLEQSVLLRKGEYTLSFQTLCDQTDNNLLSSVRAIIYNGNEAIEEKDIIVSDTWTSQSVSFTVDTQTKIRIRIEVERPSNISGTENIYVDNVMLNANSTTAEYSLIQNGNFEKIHYNNNGALTDISESIWQGNFYSDGEQDSEGINLFGRSLILGSAVGGKAYASQTVYTSATTTQADDTTYALKLSGYGYGTNQFLCEDSMFGLCVRVEYQTEIYDHYLRFEPSLKNAWQFASCVIDDNIDISEITSITVSCVYENNTGDAYFDNISLSIVPTSTNIETKYYDDKTKTYHGKVKSTIQGSTVNYYEYDNHGNVIKQLVAKLGSYKLYNYVYDTNGVNLKDEICFNIQGTYRLPSNGETLSDIESELNLAFDHCTQYVYNTYGQCVTTKLSKYYTGENGEQFGDFTALPIYQYNEYVTTSGSNIFGALKQTTDTLGNTTKYFYDETKGLLLAEVYPDNTGLSYEYDSRNRLVLTVPLTYDETNDTTTKITNQENVNYRYGSNGLLSKVTTESTSYDFCYDIFGNPEAVLLGYRTLAIYEYGNNNGKIKSLTYGNDAKVEYVYDSLDRVSQICYTENGGTSQTLYEYSYTNEGYLKRFDNNVENTSIIYSYDGSGRLTHTVECSQGESEEYHSIEYRYDGYDRLNTVVSKISDVSSSGDDKFTNTESYLYNNDGSLRGLNLTSTALWGESTFVHDDYNRVTSKNVVFKNPSKTQTYFNNTINYTYENNGTASTSTRVKTSQSTIGNETKTYTYNYDYAGYITKVGEGNIPICHYTYDDQGQLIEVFDYNTIYNYTYDNSGNIISRFEEYVYLNGEYAIYTYTYGDSQWGDLLTAFNGNTITYDEIGNPLQYYNGYVFTWKQGRRLDSVKDGNTTIASYKYNDDGIRTSKTTQWSEYKYILNGTQIVAEMWDDCINIYLYDEYGSPIGFLHRYANMAQDTYRAYFFEKNIFGDIIAIYDTSGVKQVSYTYDAFGKFTKTIHVSGTRADFNNLLYRGYYYDTETGFYYLNSRYYDPVTCRFINADGYVSTGQGLTGYNMFAYCGNNPVMRVDPEGEGWFIVIPIVIVFGVALGFTSDSDQTEKMEEKAREKYNEDTINIVDCEEKAVDGKLNVLIKTTGYNEKYPDIEIIDSHKINSRSEMKVILDYIMSHEMYDNTLFTRSKNSYLAEWEGHNFLYNIGTLFEIKWIVESARNVNLDEHEENTGVYSTLYYINSFGLYTP